jgi:GcrA cell cycle regulator
VSGPVSKYGEDVLAEIASLWADKVTTAEIGRRLDISKNSVCRLARDARLRGDPRFPERGLNFAGEAPTPRQARKSEARPAPVSAVVLVPAPPARGPFRVFDLQPHHCRYAVFSGLERGDHRFCGEPKQANSPYCAEHHALCNPSLHYVKKRA